MNKTKFIVSTLLISVVTAGLGFYGGTAYQKSQSSVSGFGMRESGSNIRFNRNGSGTATNRLPSSMRNGFRPISGEIVSVDSNSITVSLADGSSKIVLFSQSTNINKAEKAGIADLKVGEKVSIFGSQNTEGTVTAQNIQLNPAQMGMPKDMSPPPSQ